MDQDSNYQEPYESASCNYFSRGVCGSCSLLSLAPGARIRSKELRLHDLANRLLVPHERVLPIISPEHPWESRRKIKMSVTGTSEAACIGIVRRDFSSVDLTDCPLTPTPIRELLHEVKRLIATYKLTPYSITNRTGELKHLIVMSNQALSSAILRFVLRSSDFVSRIEQCAREIQAQFPWVQVVSCNIQPLPAALLEGPEEILLSEATHLREVYGDIPLYLSPQSFMQVTPSIATRLYKRAAEAAAPHKFERALDLYCGAGGFSLHLANHVGKVTGVELSESAIAAATRSASEIGASNVSFVSNSAEHYLASLANPTPDLILVNPPRRGLTEEVLTTICKLKPTAVFYSSCNPETFARDCEVLQRQYEVTEITPFDMFPLTEHMELFATFSRRP